jgi:uncharacterized protein
MQVDFTSDQRRTLLNTAAGVIRVCLGGRCGYFEAFDDRAMRPAGCFVSLHQKNTHALRGCIGRIGSKDALFPLIRLSSASVLQDPRFADNPVRLDELLSLELELSLLSPFKQRTSPLDFEPVNDGLYLTFAGRSGCFLPQVARQTGWSREQLLDRLCQEKIGVPPQSWRDQRAVLHTFTCLIIGPEPLDELGVEPSRANTSPAD